MLIDTLLNIISKFPTKESRSNLHFILRDSSKDLTWRNEISNIFYILHKLDSEYDLEDSIHQEITQETQQEEIQQEEIQQEETQQEIQQEIHQEIRPIIELTDIEKITLQYEEKVRNILQNK